MENLSLSNREVEIKAYNDGYNGFVKENIYSINDLRFRIYEEAYNEGKKTYMRFRKAR